MDKFSQIGQDLVVLDYFDNKELGSFLDIGCGFPKKINNTFILEKEFKWNGISIDLVDFTEDDGTKWSDCRKTKRILEDALLVDYKKILEDISVNRVVDFLSMDLEPPELTFECLYKIPFDDFIFNLICFEIDEGREGGEDRKYISRNYLKSKKYIFLGNLHGQDDIYLHESFYEKVKHKNFFRIVENSGTSKHTIKLFNPNYEIL
jgi:hypothetical protein